jgi:hypothetical protein
VLFSLSTSYGGIALALTRRAYQEARTLKEQGVTSRSELGRHKVANCRCRNEIFSNFFVP